MLFNTLLHTIITWFIPSYTAAVSNSLSIYTFKDTSSMSYMILLKIDRLLALGLQKTKFVF